MQTTFVEPHDAIENLDLGAWTVMVQEAVDEALSVCMPQVFERLGGIASDAGQVVDARGRPFSFDLLIEGIEKTQIDFDDEGKPQIPAVFVGPDLYAQIAALPPPTDEERARFDALIAKKKQEFDARHRHRKLD
ncbi:MAG TPA: hypothetical protein VKB92_14115 [Myxococcales bacterium]|nr:hypothetical protein [Myxococcales bacterium]